VKIFVLILAAIGGLTLVCFLLLLLFIVIQIVKEGKEENVEENRGAVQTDTVGLSVCNTDGLRD